MSLLSYSLVFVIAIAYQSVVVTGQAKLPDSIKTCKRNADDFSSCLRLAIQESWPTVVKGIPELDLQPLDPLFEKYSEYQFGSGELHGTGFTENLYLRGLKDVKFLAVRPEYTDDKFKLEVDWSLPKCFIEASFTVNANMGGFKLNGKGPLNITIEDLRVTWVISGPVKNDRWIIDKYIPKAQLGKFKFWAGNLFEGSPELTKAAIDFINEFWPAIYRGVYPYITDVWNKHYTPVMNKFFSKLSFDELFPPS